MNILFVCKHNRFRSKVAEAFFKFYDKNKKNKARSRGIVRDIPVANSVVRAMKKKGIILRDLKSRGLERKDVEWSDMIVIVADNFWIDFPGKIVLIWKIPDINQNYFRGIEKIVDKIEVKVKKLIKKLK